MGNYCKFLFHFQKILLITNIWAKYFGNPRYNFSIRIVHGAFLFGKTLRASVSLRKTKGTGYNFSPAEERHTLLFAKAFPEERKYKNMWWKGIILLPDVICLSAEEHLLLFSCFFYFFKTRLFCVGKKSM